MRIIGGSCGGRKLKVPPGLPVRPTTDFAKEGLFNILENRLDFAGLRVLDLFSGTGNISLEFSSRGAKEVTAVDQHIKCIAFLQKAAGDLGLSIQTYKDDVFSYLEKTNAQWDLIFADPPYDLSETAQIHEIVFSRNLLLNDGLLIIEHGPRTKPGPLEYFERERRYGNVHFSFFRGNPDV